MPVEFIQYTPGKTTRVVITADTRVAGRHLDAGKLVELPAEEAHALIMAQKAYIYVAPAPIQKGK